MTMTNVRRARMWGLGIVVVAFGLGIAAGYAFASRPKQGVILMFSATDQIPREIERLGLMDPQRAAIREILRRGQPKVMAVMEELEPKMRAALEATETEIGAVLDAGQRAKWEAERQLHPPATQKQVIRK